MSHSSFAARASALAVALSLALYLPTFFNSWAADDIDYINLGARTLAGDVGLWRALFHPHGEHLVAGFQALFFSYLRFVGIDAFAWRIGVAVVHALAALFLALLARRYAGSPRAGFTTAVVYVGACGFSSFWIWLPSGASVPLLLALLTGAAALLAWRDHLTTRRWIAGAAIVAALLTEGTFAPMALLPAAIDEYERRRSGRRGVGIFTIATVAAIAAAAVLTSALTRAAGRPLSIDLQHGLPRAAFLILVAPFRFFVPGIPITARDPLHVALLGSALGIAVAAALAALLAAKWRDRTPPLALVAALTLPASFGVILLVGLGRWATPFDTLYQTDRYFFPLLVPASLLAGAIAGTISLEGWSRSARLVFIAALTIAVSSELALHRRAMLGPIPRVLFQEHEARFDSLTRLVKLLDRNGPVELPDNAVWLSGVHNGQIHTSVLTEVLCRTCSHVALARHRIGGAGAAKLNALLDRWALESGEPVPFLRVVDGRLVNTRLRWGVDFSSSDCREQIAGGFYPWEPPYRWMSGRGELRFSIAPSDLELTLAAPISELHQKFGWDSMTVQATLVDERSGLFFSLGRISIVRDGAMRYSLSTMPFLEALGTGRLARLILECDRVWTPESPGPTPGPRSIQVFAAGTEEPRD